MGRAGNLTAEPQSGKTYGYSSENLLTSASGGVTLGYDPATRLYQVAGAATTRFAYDGVNAIADYDGSNALQHRYVFAPGIDQPVVQYDASGNRAFLGADERGSIVSLTDSSGTLIGLNRYDEYGKPQSTNIGRFQYTGQMWLSEIGAYYYKARVYLPHLGIFAQTDPIGHGGGINLYAYTGNDPINLTDPMGLFTGSNIPGKGAVGMANGCAGDCTAFNAQQAGIKTNANRLAPAGSDGGAWVCTNCGEKSYSDENGHIVVSGPEYTWVPASPPSSIFIPAAQTTFGDPLNKCKEAAHLCLMKNPSGQFFHEQCMELERICKIRSNSMRTLGNDNNDKVEERTYCVGPVCVTIDRHGFVHLSGGS